MPARHALAPFLLVALGSCASTARVEGRPEADPWGGPVAPAVEASPYLLVTTADELAAVIRADLDRGRAREAYRGLRALAVQSLRTRRATWAHRVFVLARPALLFTDGGGRGFVTPVNEVGRMLELEAARELEDAHTALGVGDLRRLRELVRTDRALLHPATVALASELAPHALFFEAALLYGDLMDAGTPDPVLAQRVVDGMAAAERGFRELGLEEEAFLTWLYSAQAREAAGQDELAMEAWLTAVETQYWPAAHPDLRAAVAGRITSYRDRLRMQVEGEVQGAWEARVADLEARHAERHLLALERIDELEQRRVELELREAGLEGALEEARRAADPPPVGAQDPSRGGVPPRLPGQGVELGEVAAVLDGLDAVTDIVELAQLFRGGRRR